MENKSIDFTPNNSNEHLSNSKTLILRARDMGMFFAKSENILTTSLAVGFLIKSLL